jgi:HD-GYP domain-containing protein (c-di-GMP phosphodiesterase class II)
MGSLGRHRDAAASIGAEAEKSALGDTTTTIRNALQKQRMVKAGFTTELRTAARLHAKARAALARVFTDMRSGHKLELEEIKAVAQALFESVIQMPNLMLLLTNIRLPDEFEVCHCINISIFAIAFGRSQSLNRNDLLSLGLGGMLHDLGKTRIPPLMLYKQGALNDAERNIMRNHAVDGFAALQASKQIPDSVLDIVRCHHERYDGRGYPEGLVGEHVPKFARMVALVDAYDSMIGGSGYRRPLAQADALQQLHAQATEEYGAELIQAFIRCLGTYPVGSIVELNSGAIAMVISSNANARLKPLVLQLRDEDGRYERPRLLVDLSQFNDEDIAERWGLKGKLDAVSVGLDLCGVVMEEIGV